MRTAPRNEGAASRHTNEPNKAVENEALALAKSSSNGVNNERNFTVLLFDAVKRGLKLGQCFWVQRDWFFALLTGRDDHLKWATILR